MTSFNKIVVPRHAGHADAAVEEVADDVVFHSTVDTNDVFVAVFVSLWFFDGNLINEVVEVGIVVVDVFADYNFSKKCSVFTDFLCEFASVDAGEGWNIVFFKPIAEAFAGVPVIVAF